jgi:mRNA interferase RelE/StbE
MSRVVRPSTQLIEYARRLAPEPRRALKQALAGLREERGDIRALEANLSGYYRLRVGRHRIVFNYAADGAIEAYRAGDQLRADLWKEYKYHTEILTRLGMIKKK